MDEGRLRAASPAHVLITGASGGLGAALALVHARRGDRLTLWGRDAARLEETADACRSAGAPTTTRIVDLQDVRASLEALADDDARDPVGVLILNAGLSDIRPPDATTEDPAQVGIMGIVNYATPSALATLAAARMIARAGHALRQNTTRGGRRAGGGRERIVLVGSIAAFHDLPFATAYSGSKAGLARFAHALGLHARGRGVDVLLVSPGYIDTPMSRRLDGGRPFLVTPARAASMIVRASAQGKRHLVFPWVFNITRGIDAVAPYWLRALLLGRVRVRQSPRS